MIYTEEKTQVKQINSRIKQWIKLTSTDTFTDAVIIIFIL